MACRCFYFIIECSPARKTKPKSLSLADDGCCRASKQVSPAQHTEFKEKDEEIDKRIKTKIKESKSRLFIITAQYLRANKPRDGGKDRK